MSTQGQRIVCRNCKETIDLDAGACPHCGTTIRSNTPYLVAIVVGAAMIVSAAFEPGPLLAFGVLGLFVAGGGAFILYDKRRRIQQAAERTETVVGQAASES
jgi:hypothetical protein